MEIDFVCKIKWNKQNRIYTSKPQLGSGLRHFVIVLGETLVHPFVIPGDRGYVQDRLVAAEDLNPAGRALSEWQPVLGPRDDGQRLPRYRTAQFRVFSKIHRHL